MRRIRRVVGAAWLLATAAGCGAGPTEPTPTPGRYVLETLSEAALPYDHEGLGCCTYLSGELALERGNYTASIYRAEPQHRPSIYRVGVGRLDHAELGAFVHAGEVRCDPAGTRCRRSRWR